MEKKIGQYMKNPKMFINGHHAFGRTAFNFLS